MMELPERYKRFLSKYGGSNPLNEPNFILHWGGDPVKRVAVPEAFLEGYRDCWCLAEWTPPEEFGSPDKWEAWMGPYPSRGLYLPIQIFREQGKPVMLDTEYLNLHILALLLKVIMNHKHDSLSQRYHTLKDEHARIEAARTKRLVDMIEDNAPAFLESASFFGQKNCNTAVKQKMDLIERNLSRVRDIRQRFPMGMSIATI